MKHGWIILILVFSIVTFSAGNASVGARKNQLENRSTLNFEGPESSYQIALKQTTLPDSAFLKRMSGDSSPSYVNISYIVKINTPIPESGVYLSLQDKDGFEIIKTALGSVVKNYTGNLKGNFEIKPKEYNRIRDAELYLTVLEK